MADNNSISKVSIDTTLLRSAAAQIKLSNSIMLEKAESILTKVKDLEDDWNSDVYKDFKTRVEKSGEIYQQYYNIIESAAFFLEGVANAYEDLENKMKI